DALADPAQEHRAGPPRRRLCRPRHRGRDRQDRRPPEAPRRHRRALPVLRPGEESGPILNGSLRDRLDRLALRARGALEGDILPFWLRLEDLDHGGHFAAMDNAGRIDRTAAKSTVFVARLLWTLSTVHRVLGVPEALVRADRTRRFLI